MRMTDHRHGTWEAGRRPCPCRHFQTSCLNSKPSIYSLTRLETYLGSSGKSRPLGKCSSGGTERHGSSWEVVAAARGFVASSFPPQGRKGKRYKCTRGVQSTWIKYGVRGLQDSCTVRRQEGRNDDGWEVGGHFDRLFVPLHISPFLGIFHAKPNNFLFIFFFYFKTCNIYLYWYGFQFGVLDKVDGGTWNGIKTYI